MLIATPFVTRRSAGRAAPAHRLTAYLRCCRAGPGGSPAENQLRGRRGAVARFGVTRSAFCPDSGHASKNKIPPFSFPRDVSTFSGFKNHSNNLYFKKNKYKEEQRFLLNINAHSRPSACCAATAMHTGRGIKGTPTNFLKGNRCSNILIRDLTSLKRNAHGVTVLSDVEIRRWGTTWPAAAGS